MISFNEKVKILNKQLTTHPIATTYLWFYRLIGITFGGLSIDLNGKFHINKWLKVLGYFYAIIFCIGFIICFNYMLTTDRFQSLYNHNGEYDQVAYFVVIFYYTTQLVHIIINLLYLNRRGIVFVKIFVEFKMEIKKNQRLLFVCWVIHVIIPILSATYQLRATDLGEETIFFIFNYYAFRLLSFYYFWVTSLIIWIISIHFYEYLESIKTDLQREVKKLEDKRFGKRALSPETEATKVRKITDLKAFYLKIRTALKDFDETLSLVIITDITQTMIGIMLNIWSFSLVDQHQTIKRMSSQFAVNTISAVVKLMISCFVNGLVFDESDRIHSVLDDINAFDLNDFEFKELLLFKTISRETKFGITIGGFAPLRKTTLIPIFVFILNYTIILVQTAK